MNNINYKKFKITTIKTDGKPGELVDIQTNVDTFCLENNVGFHISKCFYITNLASALSRGKHSNRKASEVLICLTGRFEIKLHNGKAQETFVLEQNDAIFINRNIWIDFYNFTDCIILAFVCIDEPDGKFSCYDFNEFLSTVNTV
jgi:mannose-6-phosphate isomerase-like protein (cupin superfamily)